MVINAPRNTAIALITKAIIRELDDDGAAIEIALP